MTPGDLKTGRIGGNVVDWQEIEAGSARPIGAAAILGRKIVGGHLTPGTTLPNIDQLAEQFSISRLSMREAIKVLAGKGLVSSTPRRGTGAPARGMEPPGRRRTRLANRRDSKRCLNPQHFRTASYGRTRGGRVGGWPRQRERPRRY